jgi:environmental stress-induced protein Ves
MTIILPEIHRKSTPWKNGGGTTAEIAIAPAGAGFDDFDWRISLATIAQSGGFSVFPGIDRTLALVDGAGVALQIDNAPLFNLNAAHPLIRFAGEAAVHATLTGGASTDFNVMTRRTACSHRVETLTFSGSHSLARRSSTTLLFLAGGDRVLCQSGAEASVFRLLDALLLTPDDARAWTLQAPTTATLFVVHITENPHD